MLLVPVLPVVNVLALTWYIRYFFFLNLQFLNNVIKVLLYQAYMTLADFGYPVYALWFYCSQIIFKYLAFQSFDYEHT